MPAALTSSEIAALPKVLLHDHLDGGVRPATLLELADAIGHQLPAGDASALADWFVVTASAGSLEAYLATFEHTLAVMQSAANLTRIAAEAVVDLAADGVVYAELRYAPELHQRGGLTGQQVVDAVREGIEQGVAEASEAGRTIRARQLLTMMRDADHGRETAELVLANRHAGVVGGDVAGPEAGFSTARHARALRMLRTANVPVTIHAGEAAGAESVADALHLGGALRLGHGVRIAEDITFGEPTPEDPFGLVGAELGSLAHWVRDQQVPLEVCPTSNLQTGAARSVATHPVTALARLGFAVTISTDNRLMSGTSPTRELTRLVDEAGWTLDDLRDVTLAAAWSAFCHLDEREEIVDDLLLPAFTRTQKGRHSA
jgi:adenosine deaminase